MRIIRSDERFENIFNLYVVTNEGNKSKYHYLYLHRVVIKMVLEDISK
jgi:hypothetical protein